MSAAHEERWTDAAAPYLLHALEPAERAAFEAHLQTCSACRRDVEHLRVAADALPGSAVQLDPPPELKERIMSVVRAEAQLLHAAGERADEPAPAARPFARGRRWALRPAVALAAVAAALALGVAGGVLGAAAVRDGERTVRAELAPAGADVRLVVDDDGEATLVTAGMPPPGRGRVYQVWIQRSGGAAPEPTNALFGVRPDGSATVDVPSGVDGVEAVLVTREPEGGSRTPSEAPRVQVAPA